MRGAIGLLVLSAAIGPPARAAAPLRATFIGNSAFEITDGRTVLFLDFPYRSGAFGYMTYSESLVRPAKNAVCLFTHAHADQRRLPSAASTPSSSRRGFSRPAGETAWRSMRARLW